MILLVVRASVRAPFGDRPFVAAARRIQGGKRRRSVGATAAP